VAVGLGEVEPLDAELQHPGDEVFGERAVVGHDVEERRASQPVIRVAEADLQQPGGLEDRQHGTRHGRVPVAQIDRNVGVRCRRPSVAGGVAPEDARVGIDDSLLGRAARVIERHLGCRDGVGGRPGDRPLERNAGDDDGAHADAASRVPAVRAEEVVLTVGARRAAVGPADPRCVLSSIGA
jgi:hypothetical protein